VVVNDLGTSHDGRGASRAEADAVTETVRQVGGVERVVKIFEYVD